MPHSEGYDGPGGPAVVGKVEATVLQCSTPHAVAWSLTCANVAECRGLAGDRQFAAVDRATGKAGRPRTRANGATFFDFRAAYAGPVPGRSAHAPVRITLADGGGVRTGQGDLEQILSRAFGREVTLEEARSGEKAHAAAAEEY